LEAFAHSSSLHAYFDEVILLLDELVGFLVTWHMVHGTFDLLFTSPHALLVHMCHLGDYFAHMLRHIVGLKGVVPSFYGDD
jgi:hypothetical protein